MTGSADGRADEVDEHRIACELEALLRDEQLWAGFEAPADDPVWREGMVARALELYARTWPPVSVRVADWAQPVDHANGLLRGVGDFCAIVSAPHPVEVPGRAALSDSIRQFDLVEWAVSLGVVLTLDDERGSTPTHENGDDDDPSAAELAADWARTMETYRSVVEMRARDTGLAAPTWTEVGESASRVIAGAQSWIAWTYRGSDDDALAVAVCQWFAAQAMFIAAYQQSLEPDAFPDKSFFRKFLETTETQWLEQYDVTVPAWLTTEEPVEPG